MLNRIGEFGSNYLKHVRDEVENVVDLTLYNLLIFIKDYSFLPFRAAKFIVIDVPYALFSQDSKVSLYDAFSGKEIYIYQALHSPSQKVADRVDQLLREQNIPASIKVIEFCRKIFVKV